MSDLMHDRCPALEPGTGERCVLYAKHVTDTTGVHVATGSWPVEPPPVAVSRGERGTRCAAPSRWYLAGRWNPGPCFLATGHPGEHMGAPPGQPWTPEPAGEVVSVPPPAPACCVDTEQGPDAHGTLLHTLGCVNRCAVNTPWYPPDEPAGSLYPCGTTVGHEGDHWAPPALRTPMAADEPAPVPPPVDALLKLIGVYGQARFAVGAAEERDSEGQATKWRGRASEAHETITDEVNALWAAGVAEGRRERVAQSNGCPQCALDDTVPDLEGDHVHLTDYGYLLFTPGHTARDYAAELIAEGRRQATEERTEEQRGDGRG